MKINQQRFYATLEQCLELLCLSDKSRTCTELIFGALVPHDSCHTDCGVLEISSEGLNIKLVHCAFQLLKDSLKNS